MGIPIRPQPASPAGTPGAQRFASHALCISTQGDDRRRAIRTSMGAPMRGEHLDLSTEGQRESFWGISLLYQGTMLVSVNDFFNAGASTLMHMYTAAAQRRLRSARDVETAALSFMSPVLCVRASDNVWGAMDEVNQEGWCFPTDDEGFVNGFVWYQTGGRDGQLPLPNDQNAMMLAAQRDARGVGTDQAQGSVYWARAIVGPSIDLCDEEGRTCEMHVSFYVERNHSNEVRQIVLEHVRRNAEDYYTGSEEEIRQLVEDPGFNYDPDDPFVLYWMRIEACEVEEPQGVSVQV